MSHAHTPFDLLLCSMIGIYDCILGVSVLEPGCKTIKIEPHLGDLEWVESTFPTPFGVVKIRHDKMPDGKVKSKIDAPKGVKVVNK